MASPRWAACTEAYRLHLQSQGRSPKTVTLHLCTLRRYENFCRDRRTSFLLASSLIIRGWLASLYIAYSRNTVRDYFLNLRTFHRWLLAEHYIDHDPFDGLPVPKPKDVPVRPYSDAELRRLLRACHLARDRLVVLMLLGSGMRAGELVGIRHEDICWETGCIH